MARHSSRYSNILATPTRYSLLETPTNTNTATNRNLHRESLISTITLSPLAHDLDKSHIFGLSPNDKTLPHAAEDKTEDGQVQRLRLWRHDALVQHQFVAAAFIGDKIFSRTNDANDAFWLAQCYYDSGHPARAHDLLTHHDLVNVSIACRYLAAQSLIRLNKWTEALSLLGEVNPFRGKEKANLTSKSTEVTDGGIKIEASMCHLRGRVFSHLNNFDRAKECYKEALLVDAKCYDALDDLLTNSLMTCDEEWSFLGNLSFAGLHRDDVEFVKMIYTTRLNKYRGGEHFLKIEAILQDQFNLRNNSDMLLSKAELLFAQCRFKDCLQMTTQILKQDQYKFSTMPLHLTCLHELGKKNDLFLLSHDMVDRHPDEAVTWLAIGIYYMSINKIGEARRHFSKASVINPRFGAAWIGFAHSFAIEGEHDQAISAYTTASRLFQGTHLPSLFLGMQHLRLNNVILADEYLNTAYNMCQYDPLLLNELGVVCFHKQQHQTAIDWFNKALHVSTEIDSLPSAWVSTHANLGHAYRRLGIYDKALEHFEQVQRLAPLSDAPHAAKGLIYLHLGRVDDSIDSLHRALALAPGDPLAGDLLVRALSEAATHPLNIGIDEQEVNKSIDHILLNAEVIRFRLPDSEDCDDYTDDEYDGGSDMEDIEYG